MTTIKHQPECFHTVIPYLNVTDADKFIAFVKKVFNATETERVMGPNNSIMHAEVRIGDSVIMVSEACNQMAPLPASLYVYQQDADAVFNTAIAAGATAVMQPMDMFWGDRYCAVKDAWNIQWSIATHIEDVTPDELTRRAAAFTEQMAAQAGNQI